MESIKKAHRTIIFENSLRRAKCFALAEDITSETFSRFVKTYGDKVIRGDDKIKLLQTIAKRVFLDLNRKSRVRREYLSRQNQNDSFSSMDCIFAELTVKNIVAIVYRRKKLFTGPELVIFKMLFEDFYLDDKPAELAKDSGLSINAVTNSKRQLFNKLRKMFKNESMVSV